MTSNQELSQKSSSPALIGIDTGGTFTDFVMLFDGRILTHKCPSTPENPARAVLEGLMHLLRRIPPWKGAEPPEIQVVHGSTVATNALLERRGARVVFLTTAGFEDVLEIGRQTRPELYNLFVEKPPPLVPAELRLGVKERMLPSGEALIPLERAELERIREETRRCHPEAIAIGLLFSYANGAHERLLAEALASLDLPLSISHQILPEYREYERFSTAVVNAYVAPKMERYLGEIEHAIPGRLRVMQSNGGSISAERARREPVHTILSGPAGGVVGAFEIGRRIGHSRVISFDMGGTSTDVSLCDGEIQWTAESVVAGCPIRVPMMDIHTVGAGGGSIATIDEGGGLRVGPQSAGADPGPICYGRGEAITVTDAHLALGRLDADHFLGGTMALHPDRVTPYLEQMAQAIGYTPGQLAEGIIQIANATMERAIRVISVERGYDPREFVLVSFGGAGALHACDLARALAIPRVIIPPHAGLLSAFGMVLADVVRDYSHTLLWLADDTTADRVRPLLEEMIRQASADLAQERVVSMQFFPSLDMRYRGQSYELNVPLEEDVCAAFERTYRRRFGYNHTEAEIEIVNVRLQAIGQVEHPRLAAVSLEAPDPSSAQVGEKRIRLEGRDHRSRLYERERLRPGHRIEGPALIFEYSATTLVPPDFRCEVDGYGNLSIEPG